MFLVSFIKAGGLQGLAYNVIFPPAVSVAFLINGILNFLSWSIEKVFKSTYKFEDFKVTSVILDSKTLVLNYSDGEVVRKDLSLPYSIKILKYELGYAVGFDTIERKIILGPIQIESDALRLKKALEHLIEILKTEKNTDPFGE